MKFCNFLFLYAAPYEQFNVFLTEAYKETSEALEPAVKVINGNKGGPKACVAMALNASQLQILDAVGLVLSKDGICTKLDDLLNMVALPACSCTWKSSSQGST